MSFFLGIDTSCYTTSLAVVNDQGHLVTEQRKVLEVPLGECGLQQSAALFQHGHNLPVLVEALARETNLQKVAGIAATSKPRPVEGSYMPVFKAAEGLGRTLAAVLKVPFIPTTHQEGHFMAGIWSAEGPLTDRFLGVHLSGGTTELLLIEKTNCSSGEEPVFFKANLLGASLDLHAGQFIDRVGVALGLPFPAGSQLEALGRQSSHKVTVPSVVKGYDISFSGPESAARRLLNQGVKAEDVSRGVEHCIANALEKVIRTAIIDYAVKDILFVGGVAANGYIRERLGFRLGHPAVGARLFFAEPRYSTDNAVGTALLAREYMIKFT